MFKRILLLLAFLVPVVLVAQISEKEIISAIKQNPALLDTPQAKAEMIKRGLDKTKIMSKVKTNFAQEKDKEEYITNDINTTINIDQNNTV